MIFVHAKTLFEKMCRVVLVSLFLLVFAGSFVRSTGSGLGCPDWPHCFGKIIPPTNVSELPENYQEIYQVAGKKVAPFDVVKTWTEYINRMLGVISGFLVIILFITSFWTQKKLTLLSFAILVTISFQGWVGKTVVSSYLHPVIITAHMVLALMLIFQVLYALRLAQSYRREFIEHYKEYRLADRYWQRFLIITLTLLLLQLFLGIAVRESVDNLMLQETLSRLEWFENLSSLFLYHRFFGPFLLWWQIGAWIFFHKKHPLPNFQMVLFIALIICFFEIIIGIVLVKFSFPKLLMPMHLTFAFLLITFYLDALIKKKLIGNTY